MLEPTVAEAASWGLATALARRHPELVVRREHPGGGQYDVLAVRSPQGCALMLNRTGTIQVHGRDDGREPDWEPLSWAEALVLDQKDLCRRLESAAGLRSVSATPLSTQRVLVYRVLAGLAGLHVLRSRVEITMGAIDTSGYFGGSAEWLARFPEIASRVERDQRPGEEPRFAYWHAGARDLEVALDVNTGDVWSLAGRRSNLLVAYRKGRRRMPTLVSHVLSLGTDKG